VSFTFSPSGYPAILGIHPSRFLPLKSCTHSFASGLFCAPKGVARNVSRRTEAIGLNGDFMWRMIAVDSRDKASGDRSARCNGSTHPQGQAQPERPQSMVQSPAGFRRFRRSGFVHAVRCSEVIETCTRRTTYSAQTKSALLLCGRVSV
jgi:hypothetical protein